jgi:hypothetical protein
VYSEMQMTKEISTCGASAGPKADIRSPGFGWNRFWQGEGRG